MVQVKEVLRKWLRSDEVHRRGAKGVGVDSNTTRVDVVAPSDGVPPLPRKCLRLV